MVLDHVPKLEDGWLQAYHLQKTTISYRWYTHQSGGISLKYICGPPDEWAYLTLHQGLYMCGQVGNSVTCTVKKHLDSWLRDDLITLNSVEGTSTMFSRGRHKCVGHLTLSILQMRGRQWNSYTKRTHSWSRCW